MYFLSTSDVCLSKIFAVSSFVSVVTELHPSKDSLRDVIQLLDDEGREPMGIGTRMDVVHAYGAMNFDKEVDPLKIWLVLNFHALKHQMKMWDSVIYAQIGTSELGKFLKWKLFIPSFNLDYHKVAVQWIQ